MQATYHKIVLEISEQRLVSLEPFLDSRMSEALQFPLPELRAYVQIQSPVLRNIARSLLALRAHIRRGTEATSAPGREFWGRFVTYLVTRAVLDEVSTMSGGAPTRRPG